MSYIKSKTDRTDLILGERSCENAGELNFLITSIIHQYIIEKGLNYQHINDVIGALEGCKAEFQRVLVAPYEDKKKRENGAISELDSVQLNDVR